MKNGNIVHYLERNKDHDRLKCVRPFLFHFQICDSPPTHGRFEEIANAIEFLHSLDPQVVHGDIRGVRYYATHIETWTLTYS